MFKGCIHVVVVIKENVRRLKIRDPAFRLPLVKGRNTGGSNSQLVVLLKKKSGIKTRS
jgi:hypothetical protein